MALLQGYQIIYQQYSIKFMAIFRLAILPYFCEKRIIE